MFVGLWVALAMTAASALPARTTMTGCLAGGGSRSADAPSRASPALVPAPVGVSVFATPTGIEIRHALSHACCLKGAVAVARRSRAITMTERLTGTACRCLCQSEITSAVALAPGRYHLVVRTAQKGGEAPAAFDGTIDVPRTRVRVTLVAPPAAPAPPSPVPPLPRRPDVPVPVETY